MDKPMQMKKLVRADANELFEAIEGALYNVRDAMLYLKGLEAFADHFKALSDLYDDMKPDFDMYEDITESEYRAEMAAQERDYYRSVI